LFTFLRLVGWRGGATPSGGVPPALNQRGDRSRLPGAGHGDRLAPACRRGLVERRRGLVGWLRSWCPPGLVRTGGSRALSRAAEEGALVRIGVLVVCRIESSVNNIHTALRLRQVAHWGSRFPVANQPSTVLNRGRAVVIGRVAGACPAAQELCSSSPRVGSARRETQTSPGPRPCLNQPGPDDP
jgi:hypothetical protein